MEELFLYQLSLKNGNIVEILTSPNSTGPSKDWLKFVKSPQAKNKIKQWFRKSQRDEDLIKGRDMLEKEAEKRGYDYNQILKKSGLKIFLRNFLLIP